MTARSYIEAHLGSRQVARVLYGSIIGLALVLALQAHPPAAGTVAASLLATAVAVGLAELYSEYVGTETRTRTRVDRAQFAEIWDEVFAVVLGIAFPAVFFLLAAIGLIERDAAFTIAKWSGLGLITAYGYAAARLTGANVRRSILRASIAGLIAAFLIVIKSLLH
jgi:VIT1/CCC1 family predicted Fe2+/Mn2+ transporter